MTHPLPRLLALSAALVALPAAAQSDDRWTGGYIGAYGGVTLDPDDGADRFLFDTNLDGSFNDSVRTAAGADAVSPGSCNGVAQGPTPAAGCARNSGGADGGVRGGYDWQRGAWVVGVVGEFGLNDTRDAVASFSTTPAQYTMLRKIDSLAALRARLGLTFGDGDHLAYATGGYARARIENTFATSNGVNTFTDSGNGSASGAQFGIGYERRIGDAWAAGVEYLATRLDDRDYRVRAAGPAPATNPFLLTNAAGTDFRRSDDRFELESLRLTLAYRF